MYASPMATGNGAFVIHKILENRIPGYRVIPYSPYRTLFPLSLLLSSYPQKTRLTHTTPDYAIFHHRKNIPLVLTFHNYVLDSFMRKYSSFLQNIHYQTDLRLLTKMAATRADALTAVSQYTAQLARDDLRLKRPVKVIYNGVDHTLFRPCKQQKFRSDKKVRVLFCGNLTQRKGAQWLKPIAERVGPNITIAYTAGLRTRNSLSVHPQLECLGTIPHHAMPAVYQSADILLFPTVREGFGLAAAEAMACGLPVVATDCSSLPELIDEGKGGFLCRIGDVTSFAQKIQLLADNPLQRREMGEYNRNKIEKTFTLEQMVNQYIELFERLLTTG
ncbi:glycosyltransferase family 4 protein [Desulfobulbus oligotrophicus]|uniref:Glycosyltransferase family 4 protein n=2 Tax=Desulfobulbus oligotrophicus TaxID=1909699 RepID=A0A7T5VDH6_9BACT|nr:glycosyltransferase family 4 protein [Desulfobulbus oligotrophicus]